MDILEKRTQKAMIQLLSISFDCLLFLEEKIAAEEEEYDDSSSSEEWVCIIYIDCFVCINSNNTEQIPLFNKHSQNRVKTHYVKT